MQRLLLIPFLLLALWGCSSETKVEDEQAASFIVGIVTASTTAEEGMNPMSVLKRGKVLNLRTCIKDYVYLTNLQYETFEVTGGKRTYHVKTDHTGCFTWSEEVDISDLVTMGAMLTERKIVGTGTYKGSVTVPLAIRLLASGGAAVIDDRYNDVPMTMAAQKQRSEGISFILGEINISPKSSNMSKDELVRPYRNIRLSMAVTIMDTEGRGIADLDFKIALIDGSESVSDINWDAIPNIHSDSTSGRHVTSTMLRYKRFAAEYYMKKYVVVKGLEAPFKDVIQVREIYVNPWQWWGRFFFWDTKWDVPGQIPQYRKIEKRTPQLLIQELFLSYTGNDENSYNVNKYMDLTFQKKYQIKFRPRINRKVSYVPGQDLMLYETLWFGVLKAKMILIRPKNGVLNLKKLAREGVKGLEDYEYVTGKEQVIEVEENLAQGNFSFEFDFRQTPFMVTRSLLLVEISPADPEWEIEPVVVTVTMKSGEFWITEGALFATELFSEKYNEGIGIFRDSVEATNAQNEEIPFANVGHPDLGQNGVTGVSERNAAIYARTTESGKDLFGETVEIPEQSADEQVRYLFMERPGARDAYDEMTSIPDHLRLKDRVSNWRYDPLQNFVKIQELDAKEAGYKFHYPSSGELNYRMSGNKHATAVRRFEGMDYRTNEERKELEREVGMKALHTITNNRKVFDFFLVDPEGIALANHIKENNRGFKSLFSGLFKSRYEPLGGDEQFEKDYFETVQYLTRLFFHGESPAAFHVLNSDNPLDYFKITPFTFLTQTPRTLVRERNGRRIETNTRKVLAGRDTMPVSLAIVDAFSEKHAQSHTFSAGIGFNAGGLVKGGLGKVGWIPGGVASNAGTVVGSLGGNFSVSSSRFKEWGQKKDVAFTSNFTLLIDQLLLEFEADQTQSCLLIQARNPDIETRENVAENVIELVSGGTDSDAYFVCYKNPNGLKTFREMWYFINTATTDTTNFVDHNNLANRPIVMPLRGVRNFVEFRDSLVGQTERFILMKKDAYEPLARRALEDLFNVQIDDIPEFLTDGEYPGVIPSDYAGDLDELKLNDKTRLGIFGTIY